MTPSVSMKGWRCASCYNVQESESFSTVYSIREENISSSLTYLKDFHPEHVRLPINPEVAYLTETIVQKRTVKPTNVENGGEKQSDDSYDYETFGEGHQTTFAEQDR
jgi:hypothetical protein